MKRIRRDMDIDNDENEQIPLDIEHEKMLQDIKKYGKHVTGEHRGIKWKTNRPMGTYLCGYIILDENIKISDEKYQKMEGYSHGGFTCGIGIDCAHGGDYFWPEMHSGRPRYIYRDQEYVETCLKKIIDCYLDE